MNKVEIKLKYDLDKVADVLHDYYSMSLPAETLEKIVAENTRLLTEFAEGAYTDTMVREDLIDAVISYYNKLDEACIKNWPMYKDSKEYSEKFYADWKVAVEKMGGQTFWNNG